VRRQLQQWAGRIAEHLAPRSGAYHEVWLNGRKLLEPAGAEEPIYGKVYLPRKFKTGLSMPHDNCVDIYAQDLGLLALVERDQITGFNVLIGGGMGMTHGNTNTFPFIGREICWIEPGQVVQAAEAAVKLFRDHGNRGDRKRARIKYLVHDWGVERFRQTLTEYLPFPLVLPKPVEITGFDLHLGWHAQGDGKYCLGISIENGRVKDEGAVQIRTGLRKIIERFRPQLSITPQQDLLLRNLSPAARPEIDKLLTDHHIRTEDRISLVQQYSMACPAIPTCGLAITESERALPIVVDEMEALVRELGLEQEKISIRMTGCPNGCVRPYQSDIGLVGRSGDKFTVFVGGHVYGTRLNFLLRDLVPQKEIVPLLRPLLEDYRIQRRGGEGFGDYCQRLGQEEIQRRAGVALMESATH
jgi:sulfite reductase (ferredoxin)